MGFVSAHSVLVTTKPEYLDHSQYTREFFHGETRAIAFSVDGGRLKRRRGERLRVQGETCLPVAPSLLGQDTSSRAAPRIGAVARDVSRQGSTREPLR